MPSTYTVNLGIEKPATGEQSGTWGDTVNDNSNIIDEAINGVVTITLSSAGSSGSPNQIAITNGASSTGRNKWIEFADGGDLSAAAYVQLIPNDAEKICFIRNSLAGSRSVFIFQGTYSTSNDLEIAAGTDVLVKFNGAGTGATVVNVYANLKVDALVVSGAVDAATVEFNSLSGTGSVAVTNILDEDNLASNSATVLATQQSIKAYVDAQVDTVDTLAETLAIGNTTSGTDIETTTTDKVQFRDAAIYINSSADGQLDIVADTEVQIAATTIDINGAINASGEIIAASLDISGNIDIDGTANLDVVDIDGATQADGTITVGVDDTGYDVKFFGATSGSYLLWNESIDDLTLAGAAGLVVQGNADFSGITNLDVTDIDGAVNMATTLLVTGEATLASHLNMGDGDVIKLGTGADLQIYHDGNNALFTNTTGNLYIQDSNGTVHIQGKSGEESITAAADGAVTLYHNNAAKLASTAAGVTVTGTVTSTGTSVFASLDISGDIDVDGTTNLDVLDVDGAVDFASTTAHAGNATFADNAKAIFGAGSDLQLFHDGSNSYIKDAGTGVLFINATDGVYLNGATTDEPLARFIENGAVSLYHDNALKLATTATGINVTGNVIATGTVEPAGDTAAGDNAAVGYTAAEGLILTGQGSTSDVTIKNDADATVLCIPTGTTKVGIGTTTLNSNQMVIEGGVGAANGSSLAIKTGGGANSRVADLAFYGTFVTPDSDTGQRRTADITSGFHSANWGNEFLAFGVGTGSGNDAAAVTTERMRITGDGTVNVVGTFTAGTKTFKIDHPLPAKTDTHYLLHSSIEGPQADLIYRGRADLASGTVEVNIDTAAGMTEGTFAVLCGDVQCFTSNEDGWTALKGSVTGNLLTITAQDNTCTDTVSWMVIGERKDAKMIESEWADDNGKLVVETLKSEH